MIVGYNTSVFHFLACLNNTVAGGGLLDNVPFKKALLSGPQSLTLFLRWPTRALHPILKNVAANNKKHVAALKKMSLQIRKRCCWK